jgi:hypothetical protein
MNNSGLILVIVASKSSSNSILALFKFGTAAGSGAS